MTDPIDLASIANFDPIDVVPDDRDPHLWVTLADRLDEAMRERLLDYGSGIL